MTKVLRIITRLNIGGPAIHVTNLNYYLDKDYGYQSVLVYGSLAEGEGSMEYLAERKQLKTILLPELGREISILGDLSAVWKLYKIMKAEKPDIVHTHTAKAGFSGRIAAKLAGVKKIYHTFHGNVFQGYFNPLKTKIFILLEKLCALFTNKIIVISEQQKTELIKNKIAGVEKIEIIPLGFELDKIKDIQPNKYLRQKFNIPNDCKIAGLIGRLVPIKNHSYFIEIAEKVLQKIDNIRFLIIGDGELKSELERNISARGLTGKIIITGFINEPDKIYGDLDLVLLTSKNEGTPVTIIEAMACGKPVLSTNVGGVGDVLQGGKYGYLEGQNDSDKFAKDIIAALMNYEKAKQTALAGREYILTKYDVKRLLADLHKLYSIIN